MEMAIVAQISPNSSHPVSPHPCILPGGEDTLHLYGPVEGAGTSLDMTVTPDPSSWLQSTRFCRQEGVSLAPWKGPLHWPDQTYNIFKSSVRTRSGESRFLAVTPPSPDPHSAGMGGWGTPIPSTSALVSNLGEWGTRSGEGMSRAGPGPHSPSVSHLYSLWGLR